MSQPMVRPFHDDDAARVRALSARLAEGVASWREADRVHQTIAGWVDRAIADADNPDHLLLVAVDADDTVVGFSTMTVQQHYISGIDAYLGELVVDQAAEGRGIGRSLLQSGESWAAAKGCERITLQTGAANHRARSFYAALGFEEEDVSLARPIDRHRR